MSSFHSLKGGIPTEITFRRYIEAVSDLRLPTGLSGPARSGDDSYAVLLAHDRVQAFREMSIEVNLDNEKMIMFMLGRL